MSITSSFYSGLSGLDTQGIAMQVIGDNIANMRTSGFKGSSIHFEDVLGQSLSGVSGGNQTGAGTKASSIDLNFIQGSLETTDVATDVAINGKGFFIVEDASMNEQFYTRAGHFSIDNQGYLVNNNGYRVQGYSYDPKGLTLLETLADIQIGQNSMVPPKETSEVGMVVNLDVSETTKTWDITDPSGSSHYSTALTVYDSVGQNHQIQIYFTKTADQTWEWHAIADGADIQGGTPGVYQLFGTGTLNFDTSGELTGTPTMPVSFYTGTLTYANGIVPSTSTIDFAGTSQYGSPSAIQSIAQNGYTAGTVSGVGIDETGSIVANYTNGIIKNIARFALADFPSLSGLSRIGSTLYQTSPMSGDPLYNKPGEGGVGSISSSMLEESNVDLAAEFIRMIIIQRGYQANSKVISTTDEMLAQLMNIR
jgi:flagellar hook protein FlgE